MTKLYASPGGGQNIQNVHIAHCNMSAKKGVLYGALLANAREYGRTPSRPNSWITVFIRTLSVWSITKGTQVIHTSAVSKTYRKDISKSRDANYDGQGLKRRISPKKSCFFIVRYSPVQRNLRISSERNMRYGKYGVNERLACSDCETYATIRPPSRISSLDTTTK